jgi:formyl-CoA transferase
MFVDAELPDGSGKIPVSNSPLQMSLTPLKVERSFPSVGQHNEEVYTGILGYTRKQVAKLEEDGII